MQSAQGMFPENIPHTYGAAEGLTEIVGVEVSVGALAMGCGWGFDTTHMPAPITIIPTMLVMILVEVVIPICYATPSAFAK